MDFRRTIQTVALLVAAWASFPMMASGVTLPDTDCSEVTVNSANNLDYAAGIGAPSGSGPNAWVNPPHAYAVSGGSAAGLLLKPNPQKGFSGRVSLSATDTCTNYGGLGDPTLFSGELGFAIGGAYLFARAGADGAGDGEGTVGCFGAFTTTGAHHGPHTVIHVLDDLFGGAVGFSVMADWNRTVANLGTGNNAGIADCGDGFVEPCNPAGAPPITEPFCNSLDHQIEVARREDSNSANYENFLNIWTGNAGGYTDPNPPPTFPDLGAFAGADGTVPLAVFGTISPLGQIWTDNTDPPVGVPQPSLLCELGVRCP